MIGLVAGVLPAAAADAPDHTISVLVQEGQAMPDGDGTVGLVNDVSVNDAGDWIADVAVTGGSVTRALIRNGQVWAKPGDAIDPNDTISSVSNALKHMNSAGDVAWRPGLSDNHSGMYLNFTPLILRNEISAWPGFAAGTEYTGFFRGRVTEDQNVAMIATLSEPDLGTIRSIIWLDQNSNEDVLITRYDPAPGIDPSEGVTINLPANGANNWAISNDGDVLWHTTLGNTPTATNGALYRNLELLVRKGDPSPVNGDAYSNIGATSFRVDMNNHGDYLFLSFLDGHPAGANVLVKDVGDGHEVVALMGDVAPDLDGVRLINHFGSGVQPFITDNGDVVWYARFDGETETNHGLYFNDNLIIQKGVTEVAGSVLEAVCGTTASSNGITNSLMVSPSGEFAILRARFIDGSRAALLVEFEADPCILLGDLNCDGVVDVSDLLMLLSLWGPFPPGSAGIGNWGPCPGPGCPDLNNDGVVDISDLLILLSNWG